MDTFVVCLNTFMKTVGTIFVLSSAVNLWTCYNAFNRIEERVSVFEKESCSFVVTSAAVSQVKSMPLI